MAKQEEKGNSSGFTPGYIFPISKFEREENRRTIDRYRQREGKSAMHGGSFMWNIWGAPLVDYARDNSPIRREKRRMDFKAHLLEKMKGGKIKVLDVGVGPCTQWREVCGERRLEFQGTALVIGLVHPKMRKFVTQCSADELHLHFKKGYFDIVVSHYGTHGQQKEALENMLWVAKGGGEIIVSGKYEFPNIQMGSGCGANYSIVSLDAPSAGEDWFYHLEKK